MSAKPTTKQLGRLHVITDESIQRRFSHAKLAGLAVSGGADAVQFRDKRMGTRKLVEAAAVLKRICANSGIPLIINDRVDIAMAVDADGVHLGSDDIPIAVARKLLGPNKIIGGSAGTMEEALLAESEGADYIGFGHIYPTSSKEKPTRPRGLERLKEVCSAVEIPVIAIGGIALSNIEPVIRAGAFGVAVISAVCSRKNPEAATTALRRAIDRAAATMDEEESSKR
ncbi:MAG: thiamine phosphate synthase [Candidatus Latescibacteria bacterium]|nr:thiamine phosphate synthase [Candidatus Latescibacterota bacterium]NIM21798.1 thiamine phosphate synthase [Candidatus Latescibacterota bacterium]NIM65936.1 thiamine phosphate synthase [Candidatus Latescibacterota bacterium]NIO02681.1 thiamine phosphate synthase [Candidatus Latescibacterota bacterium]NIO29662.1 thiamine phosphate synthase [Candidatus Latescibacterota bacterium]